MSLLDAFLLEAAPVEYWISARTDGVKGSGRMDDPWSGSTQQLFDEAMNVIQSKVNVIVHLGPGTFLTKGYGGAAGTGWQARPGLKIRGAGVDVTTLQLVASTTPGHYFAVGHPLTEAVHTFELSDLTIKCDIATAPVTAACGGVRVMGDHVRIERVRVTDWGTKSAGVQAYALSLITSGPAGPEMVNSAIENCIVGPPGSTATHVTAFNLGTQADITSTVENHARGGAIRNCYFDGGLPGAPSPNGLRRGIAVSWCRGGIIEGNQIYNTDVAGPIQDQRSLRDLIVRNNFFKNVGRAVYLNLGQLGSNLLTGNGSKSVSGGLTTISGGVLNVGTLSVGDRISVTTTDPSPPATYAGVYEITSVQSSVPIQVTVRGSLPGSTVTVVKKLLSIGRAIIEGNVIELAAVSGAVAIAVDDNNAGGSYTAPPEYAHGDFIVRNNKIRYVDGAPPSDLNATLIDLSGAKNVMVKDNVLDTIAATPLRNQRCGAATYFNNKKPNGVLIRGLNSVTSTKYDELETEAEDALVLSLFNER